MKSFSLLLPKLFNFAHAIDYLNRSPRELLHTIHGEQIIKAVEVNNDKALISIRELGGKLKITCLNKTLTTDELAYVKAYVCEWLDLHTDLQPFYSKFKDDPLLKGLLTQYQGYRIVGQPDLFESIVWAVLGQQINLSFAYTLKARFVEKFGERVVWDNESHYLFPHPTLVANLTPDVLLALQFSKQKAAYTIGIAQAFADNIISKEKLKNLSLSEAKEQLIKIKGIGNWTANYALMKTFRYPDAFPLEDVGIHNAIKNLKQLKAKPNLDQVKRIFKRYKGWEAYATIYLWKSL